MRTIDRDADRERCVLCGILLNILPTPFGVAAKGALFRPGIVSCGNAHYFQLVSFYNQSDTTSTRPEAFDLVLLQLFNIRLFALELHFAGPSRSIPFPDTFSFAETTSKISFTRTRTNTEWC